MFFEEKRIVAVREMILAETPEQRRRALAKILPMQREDFAGIFREMAGRPVTIRLLDPPLHEFLPHDDETIERTAKELNVPADKVRERTHALKEANPMLGHRGCRLGITNPEIYEMQVRAIFEAASQVISEGGQGPARDHDPARRRARRVRAPPRRRRGRGEAGHRREQARHPVQDRHDDRGPARGAARQPDRAQLRLLLLRNERPDADDLRLLARRHGHVPAGLHRRGDPARGSRSRASTSTAWASSSRSARAAAGRSSRS